MENNINAATLNNEQVSKVVETVQQLIKVENETGLSNKVTHKEILKHLLDEVERVNLKAIIALPDDENLRANHLQYGVVKYVIETANRKNLNMCSLNDYVYMFDGTHWKQHNKEDIKMFLTDAAVKMGIPAYIAKTYGFADGLFKQFMCDAHFKQPEPDNKKVLINLQNGTFEFKNGKWEKKAFDPNDFLTYQLPFAYDPEAKCPKFDSYLAKVLPDECSRMVLQEFSGYVFTDLNLEKCLVLKGDGCNGKSVFFRILNALVGAENTLNFSMSSFSEPGNRAKLSNVLMNYCSDTGFNLAPETFKALVSGEPVQARELYCKPFALKNKAKFIMNCNELPKETENTHAYFRRYEIIPWNVTISDSEKNINLADEIIADELPGIYNWLLVGLERIVKQERFTACANADCALEDFKKQADTVELFLEDNNLQPSATEKMSLQELYNEYENFCRAEKIRIMGKSSFSKELERKGIKKLPRTNAGIFFGIGNKVIE
jgi:putative DNA primase/helicase